MTTWERTQVGFRDAGGSELSESVIRTYVSSMPSSPDKKAAYLSVLFAQPVGWRAPVLLLELMALTGWCE